MSRLAYLFGRGVSSLGGRVRSRLVRGERMHLGPRHFGKPSSRRRLRTCDKSPRKSGTKWHVLEAFCATLRYSKPIRNRGFPGYRVSRGRAIGIGCRWTSCDDERRSTLLPHQRAKQRLQIAPKKVAQTGSCAIPPLSPFAPANWSNRYRARRQLSAIPPLSPFAPAKGRPARMAQTVAGAIAPARGVEERTLALRGFPETRRQWERSDIRGQQYRRRPTCCETLAPLTVLSPGPRLAGMPSEGLKIWDQLGFDLPTTYASNLRNGASAHRDLPANHKRLRIWHYLALFGTVLEYL